MARIAYFRDCLKTDFFKHLQTLDGLLSADDVMAAAAKAGHVWRTASGTR